MFQALKLYIPALVPSWRFFDSIGPSPRIQFAVFIDDADPERDWNDFRPRPHRVTPAQMLKRLFWNPQWNETLYLVACAERLMDEHSRHCEDEIFHHIHHQLQQADYQNTSVRTAYLQFRLVCHYRQGQQLHQDVVFYSRNFSLSLGPAQ